MIQQLVTPRRVLAAVAVVAVVAVVAADID
jgi:hypothetical protein